MFKRLYSNVKEDYAFDPNKLKPIDISNSEINERNSATEDNINKLKEKETHIQERITDLINNIESNKLLQETKKETKDYHAIAVLQCEFDQLESSLEITNNNLKECQQQIALKKLDYIKQSISYAPISSDSIQQKSREIYKKKFEEYVNSKKEIILPAKSFLSHMIEDAANKGVRHLHIGHYISFEGFKKSFEKNLIDVKQDLMIAAVFLKEICNIEDTKIIEGKGYDQDIVMNFPQGNHYFKDFETYFDLKNNSLQNIPGITRKIYFKITNNKGGHFNTLQTNFSSISTHHFTASKIHFTCFSTSDLNTPLFFHERLNNNKYNNMEVIKSYDYLLLQKYFFKPLSILENSKSHFLDEATYFDGLFNLFVIHDGQLVNFKTSSLMNMFRVEQKSIASFHQVLFSDEDYSQVMELDLNQNGYSGHFDNVLKNLPNFQKKLLEQSVNKTPLGHNIEKINKFGLNILYDMQINNPETSEQMRDPQYGFGKSLYMSIFKYYDIFYESFFLDLWDKFKITDVDFLNKAKNMFTLTDADVIEVDLIAK